MTSSFGEQVRAARRRAGLSQAELGGERYSGSYVSHLESGRRTPTPELVAYLADRLGCSPEELGDAASRSGPTGAGPAGTEDTTDHSSAARLLVLQTRAREAARHGHHHQTVDLAREGAAVARDVGHDDAAWSFGLLEAETLLQLEQYDACVEVATSLASAAPASASPELAVEALALAARALRAAGHLEEALDRAEQAVEASRTLEASSPSRVLALLTRLSSLGELGRASDVQRVGLELADLRDQVGSEHLRGQVAWALGNLAFLRGDVTEGAAQHDLAATLISREHDLRTWGRLARASAAMRLQAGVVAGVERLLDDARRAIELVGNEGDRHELELTRAELAFRRHDAAGALAILDVVEAVGNGDVPQARAEAAWLRSRCLEQLGDAAGARDAARDAALSFERAGALERAVRAWRTHARLEQPVS
ncbi:helix-turn-helix transcriptional regulator [Nocardioides zeae]